MTFYIAEFYNALGNRLYNSEIFQELDFDDAVEYVRSLERKCNTAVKFQLFEVDDWTNTTKSIDVIVCI